MMNGRNSLPHGGTHQLVIQYQSSALKACKEHTKHIVFIYLETHTHTHAHTHTCTHTPFLWEITEKAHPILYVRCFGGPYGELLLTTPNLCQCFYVSFRLLVSAYSGCLRETKKNLMTVAIDPQESHLLGFPGLRREEAEFPSASADGSKRRQSFAEFCFGLILVLRTIICNYSDRNKDTLQTFMPFHWLLK